MDFDKMKKRNAYIDQFKKADMFKVRILNYNSNYDVVIYDLTTEFVTLWIEG